MNEFLARLERCLKHMDAEEKREVLQDYREHFEIGMTSGKTEEQIAKALGEPEQLAKMFSAMGAAGRAHEAQDFLSTIRMIGAFLSYKVGGGIMMTAVYFACLSVMLMLFAGVLGLIAGGAGMLLLVAAEFSKGLLAWALMALFTAMILGPGGLLCWMGLRKLWRRLFKALPLLAHRMMQNDAGKKAIV